MPAASWKGTIQFGPTVVFPVVARGAVRETKFAFNLHHATCGGRARSGQSVCDGCGEFIGKDEIVRGYEGKPGIDDEYIKSLALEKTERMELDGLVPAEQIDPRYYAKSYTVEPQKGGEKVYMLMLRLLEKHKKVGIGKVIMGGKEQIVTLRPRNGVLAMEVMYWPEELVSDANARVMLEGVDVTKAEVAMGDQLVKYLSRNFDPESYVNEYAVRMTEYLQRFMNDEVQPAVPTPKAAPQAVTNLEDALAASIRALGGEVEEKVAKRTGRKKVA